MHRAIPMGKSMDHWIKLSQELHHSRLKSMKPSVDNKQPKVYSHLQTKKKREQLMLERYAQIEKENRILLEKMAEIMGRPAYLQAQTSVIHFKSLNAEARRRRMKKITEENQQILKRIQASGPNYNHRVWDQHWASQQVYLKNLCEYPCILLGDAADRPGRTLHLDRKTATDPKRKSPSAPLPSSAPTVLPSLHRSQFASTSDLHGNRRKKLRSRRRKQKPAVGAAGAAPPPARVVLREGRNVDGTYVIISVLEIAADPKRGVRRSWQYKVYDPQFADEVCVDVDYAALGEFVGHRPELLLESRQKELAALTLSKLHVDSSSGCLRAGFSSDLVPAGDKAHFETFAVANAASEDYEEDEFGTEADLIPPRPPVMTPSEPEPLSSKLEPAEHLQEKVADEAVLTHSELEPISSKLESAEQEKVADEAEHADKQSDLVEAVGVEMGSAELTYEPHGNETEYPLEVEQ